MKFYQTLILQIILCVEFIWAQDPSIISTIKTGVNYQGSKQVDTPEADYISPYFSRWLTTQCKECKPVLKYYRKLGFNLVRTTHGFRRKTQDQIIVRFGLHDAYAFNTSEYRRRIDQLLERASIRHDSRTWVLRNARQKLTIRVEEENYDHGLQFGVVYIPVVDMEAFTDDLIQSKIQDFTGTEQMLIGEKILPVVVNSFEGPLGEEINLVELPLQK